MFREIPRHATPTELRLEVWRHLRFLGAPSSAADDLVQETMMIWLEKRASLDPGRDPAPWLRGTARNLWRRTCARPHPEVLGLDDAQLEARWQQLQGEDAGTHRRAALAACLESLGPRGRRALALRYGEDASREAIAQALGIRAEGVKTLLRRLRDQLRRCVTERMES